MRKKFKKKFDLKMAIFSLLFWTLFVALLELTIFKFLLDMSNHDIMVARLIGAPFNFFIGGFYHTIYDLFVRGWGIAPKIANYGAIGVIKLVVNILIYSSKWFAGGNIVFSTVLLKASIVVIAGTLAASYYKKSYHVFGKYYRLRKLKKHSGFQELFIKQDWFLFHNLHWYIQWRLWLYLCI